MNDLVTRLRKATDICEPTPRSLWGEAADAISRLQAENERLRKIEAAARALQFAAYPAHGSGFVIQVVGGNINDLEAALTNGKRHDEA